MGYRRLDPKTKQEREDVILKLVEQGVHYEDIGRQVGLSRRGVSRVVQKRRKKNGTASV